MPPLKTPKTWGLEGLQDNKKVRILNFPFLLFKNTALRPLFLDLTGLPVF